MYELSFLSIPVAQPQGAKKFISYSFFLPPPSPHLSGSKGLVSFYYYQLLFSPLRLTVKCIFFLTSKCFPNNLPHSFQEFYCLLFLKTLVITEETRTNLREVKTIRR